MMGDEGGGGQAREGERRGGEMMGDEGRERENFIIII